MNATAQLVGREQEARIVDWTRVKYLRLLSSARWRPGGGRSASDIGRVCSEHGQTKNIIAR